MSENHRTWLRAKAAAEDIYNRNHERYGAVWLIQHGWLAGFAAGVAAGKKRAKARVALRAAEHTPAAEPAAADAEGEKARP